MPKSMYKSIFIKSKVCSYIDKFCVKVIQDINDINVEGNEILNKFLKRFKDECIQKLFIDVSYLFKSRQYKQLGDLCLLYEVGLRDIADMIIDDRNT